MKLTYYDSIIVKCAAKHMDHPLCIDGDNLILTGAADADIDDLLYCISLLPEQAKERGYSGHMQTKNACDRVITAIEAARSPQANMAAVEYDRNDAIVSPWRMGL